MTTQPTNQPIQQMGTDVSGIAPRTGETGNGSGNGNAPTKMRLDFLTEVLNRRVVNASGAALGRVDDLVAQPPPDHAPNGLPEIVALMVKQGGETRTLRYAEATWAGNRIVLPAAEPYAVQPGDLCLRQEVLDRQIVDTADFRVVRVSDVRLAAAPNGSLVVLGVDPGQVAVLRRLLPDGWGDRVTKALRLPDSGGFIAWHDMEPTGERTAGGVLRLRTTRDKISELHPADIADILEQMNPSDRNAVMQTLDVETAADVVTEADDDLAVELMQQLPTATAADILEEMQPDDAADVVGDMPGSLRRELLDEMEQDEAQDVRDLLHYAHDTAGGLMTTEFVALPTSMTAEQAIERLRQSAPDAEAIYYLYITVPLGDSPDAGERLVGVISLRDLVVSPPQTPLWNIMDENVIRIGADASLEEVASTLDHYDLLAVPVVDREERLQGIVTVDDTLEELLPPSWRRWQHRSRRNKARRVATPPVPSGNGTNTGQ